MIYASIVNLFGFLMSKETVVHNGKVSLTQLCGYNLHTL